MGQLATPREESLVAVRSVDGDCLFKIILLSMQNIHQIEQAISESSGLETNPLESGNPPRLGNLFTLSPESKTTPQILPRSFSSIRPANMRIGPERVIDRFSPAEAIARETAQTRNRLAKKDRKTKIDSSPVRTNAYDLRSSTIKINNLEDNENGIILEHSYSYYKQAEFYKRQYDDEIDEQEEQRQAEGVNLQESAIHIDSKSTLFGDTDRLDTIPIMASQISSRDQLSSRNILNQQRAKKFSTKKARGETEKSQTNLRFGKLVIPSADITDVADFIRKPIGEGRVLQCTLVRNKSCSKMFFIDYDLVTASDEKFLLSTKKMPLKFYSTYNISLQVGSYDETSDYYVGKSMGNFSGSIFNLQVQSSSNLERQIVATIHYKSDCFDFSPKAREIEIYLKSQDYSYDELDGADRETRPNLMYLYDIGKNKEMKKIRKLVNKKPKWNAATEVFSLNFHGRSKIASVKNTIIIDEERPDDYLLLLAKQGSDRFAMDISYPFSPIVALGLMISGFDFKLASQ